MWSDRWVGARYEDLGRGPRYDCLGLFLAVQREDFGRDLPDPALTKETRHAPLNAHRSLWQRCEVATPGAAIVFRFPRWWHIGVAVNSNLMLHITDDSGGAVVVNPHARVFGRRLEGIYQYVG